MERDLEAAKRMNKTVIILIVIMLLLMSVLVANLAYLAKQYKQLEGRYIELYEEMAGREQAG